MTSPAATAPRIPPQVLPTRRDFLRRRRRHRRTWTSPSAAASMPRPHRDLPRRRCRHIPPHGDLAAANTPSPPPPACRARTEISLAAAADTSRRTGTSPAAPAGPVTTTVDKPHRTASSLPPPPTCRDAPTPPPTPPLTRRAAPQPGWVSRVPTSLTPPAGLHLTAVKARGGQDARRSRRQGRGASCTRRAGAQARGPRGGQEALALFVRASALRSWYAGARLYAGGAGGTSQ